MLVIARKALGLAANINRSGETLRPAGSPLGSLPKKPRQSSYNCPNFSTAKEIRMATPSPQTKISIDLTKDLESASALKHVLSANQGAMVTILHEIAQYAGQPVAQ